MSQSKPLKARAIERLENTSVAAALMGAVPAGESGCTGICVATFCETWDCNSIHPEYIVIGRVDWVFTVAN